MAFLHICLAVLATLCVCAFQSSEACSCRRRKPTLLQDLFCKSDYVIEVTALHDELVTEQRSTNLWSYTKEMLRYTVNTSNVYKTSPMYEALENKNFIFTGKSSASCKIYLKENVTYVIFGGLSSTEKNMIYICNFWGFQLDSLNDDQVLGLQYAYKENCKCKIDYCREKRRFPLASWWMPPQEQLGGCDNKTVSADTCVVDQDTHYAAFQCFNKHAVCKAQPTRQGDKCLWDDLGMRKFESCLDNLPKES